MLAGAVLVTIYPTLAPFLEELLGRAAILSTALTMPEGAALTLQERFAPELYAPDGLFPEEEEGPQPPPPPSSSQAEPSSQESDPRPQPSGGVGEIPEIPEEFRGVLREVCITGEDNASFYRYRGGWIRNYTRLDAQELQKILATPYQGTLTKNAGAPQILIYHTHATESYETFDSPYYDTRNTWRSTEQNKNMVAVGDALKEALEAQGFTVIHDVTQHDYPSYNGAYERSRETVEGYLKAYPTIQVLLDVHRDAILYDDGSVAKPTAEIDGEKAAQVMIATACDDGSTGVPNWQQNFRLAAALEAKGEEMAPGLLRPVFFAYRNYNQDLSPQALLLEFGSNGNTLEEAQYAARLLAPVLGEVLARP